MDAATGAATGPYCKSRPRKRAVRTWGYYAPSAGGCRTRDARACARTSAGRSGGAGPGANGAAGTGAEDGIMRPITQELLAFVTHVGRALLALLIQLAAPVLALCFFLVVPSWLGCLGYAVRPGFPCYGWSSGIGLVEHATAMLPLALAAARPLWPFAFLCTLVALLTKWRPRTQWVRAGLLGTIGFVGTRGATASADWYVSGTGLFATAAVGGAVAACVLPRLIVPGQRLNRPLAVIGLLLAIVVLLFAGLIVLTQGSASPPIAPF